MVFLQKIILDYIVIHEKPPSTEISVPVTKLEASDANQNTTPNNSSGLPKRSIGVCFNIAFSRSGVIKFFLFHSVGKKPGLIALTLTPFSPHSLPR